MGVSEDPKNNMPEVPDEDAESWNWLDKPVGETESLWDESDAQSDNKFSLDFNQIDEDGIPEWLKADLDDEVAHDEKVPDWLLAELDKGEHSEGDLNAGLDESAIPISESKGDFEMPGEMVEELSEPLVSASMMDTAGEEETVGELGWLDKIIAGEVKAIEEPPTMSWKEEESLSEVEPDDFLDDGITWLEDLDTIPELDLVEEMVDQGQAEETSFDPELIRTEESSEAYPEGGEIGVVAPKIESQIDTKSDRSVEDLFQDDSPLAEVPDDPDEAMAWLEQLAARQGAPMEELTSMATRDLPEDEISSDFEPAVKLPEAELDSGDGGEDDAAIMVDAVESEAIDAQVADQSADTMESAADEIPDDPDEAMAWLERLAARQGAPAEELTIGEGQIEKEATELTAKPAVKEDQFDQSIAEMAEVELPEDLDEALSWLEEMVDSSFDEISDAEIVEEAPTPVEAFDVETVRLEAEAFAEARAAQLERELLEQSTGSIDEEDEDTAEAFAWLDQLAAEESEIPVDIRLEEDLEAIQEEPLPSLTTEMEPIEEREKPPVEEERELDWLDTLGSVRADQWLEAEAEASDLELEVAELAMPTDLTEREELPSVERVTEKLPEGEPEVGFEFDEVVLTTADQEQLEQARMALGSGKMSEAIDSYELLLRREAGLPLIIHDLETTLGEYDNAPLLCRMLGDAYARNGQLNKALEIYRQALDNI